MKKLELNQMENLNGGSNGQAVACGIGFGLLTGGATAVAGLFVIMAFCLNGDSN
jgi:hypothetical protein